MYLYNLSPADDGILASRPGHGIGYTLLSALRHVNVVLQHRHVRRTTAGYANRCLPSPVEIQYRNGRQAGNCTRPRTPDAIVRLNRHRCISHESKLRARFVPQHGAWFPTAKLLPGRLHTRARIHLHTVTKLPASDSVLRAFFSAPMFDCQIMHPP